MTTRTTGVMRQQFRITIDVAWRGFPLSQEQRFEIGQHISQFLVEERGAAEVSTVLGFVPIADGRTPLGQTHSPEATDSGAATGG